MQKWEKTTIKWNCFGRLDTVIPVTDWPHPDKTYVHTVHALRAISQPDQRERRTGRIEIQINRVSISPTDQRQAIKAKLEELKEVKELFNVQRCDGLWVEEPKPHDGTYVIAFVLQNGASFCETAILIVRELYGLLLKEGDPHFYLTRDFTITRETFTKVNGGWIPYASYLRFHLRLGMTGEDMPSDAA